MNKNTNKTAQERILDLLNLCDPERADELMRTSEVSELTGWDVRTLKNWHKEGILIPDELTDGGHRRYKRRTIIQARIF